MPVGSWGVERLFCWGDYLSEYAVGKGAFSFGFFEDDNFCIFNFKGIIQMNACNNNKYSSYMCGWRLCNINSYTETLLQEVFKMSIGLQKIDDELKRREKLKKCGKDATATFKGLNDI